MRLRILCLAAIASLASLVGSAQAQTYPSRPVRMIVPFAPGGGNDIAARIVADKLTALWNVGVVIENRAGAGGNLGAEAVNTAAPDGYTLLFSTQGPLAVNRSLYAKIPYDPDHFTPISLVASSANVLAASSKAKFGTLRELIDYAKAHPDTVTYASSGAGTTAHLAGAMLDSMAHIKLVHVPYRGTGPAVNDLVSAQVDIMFAELSAVGQFVQAGSVKALGIGSATPDVAIPGIAPISIDLPGFAAATWYGVVGPHGVPEEIVRKIAASINEALADSVVKDRMSKLNITPIGGSAADLTAFMNEEKDRWAKVIHDANISVN